ncbi:MAG: hypothetical protein ACSLE6_18795 [Mycobacterium sp.]
MTAGAGARLAGQAFRILAAVTFLSVLVAPSATPPAAAGEPGTTPFLTVRIDTVSPNVVTTTSDAFLTVTGTVSNVGDRVIRDVDARLEFAPAVDSSAGLRTDLDGAGDQYQPVGQFVTLAAELDRGQSTSFTFTYPFRSDTEPAFGIAAPGVYPVLVNVNGTPDYGAPARLDDARFLLPVLGVPADPDVDPTASTLTTVIPPDTSHPVATTMLWPLADQPRLAPGVPGATAPVRLADDDLAAELSPGGRLDMLLSTAEFATSPAVDPARSVTAALCLAVDPDLLVSVNAMTAGYVVLDNADDPSSATHPGVGQLAATDWLTRLRELAARVCVAPAPFAQADLDALARVGDPGLSAIATNGAGDIVDQILGVRSVRGATLLGDGRLTQGTVDLLGQQGSTVAVTAANSWALQSETGLPMTADVAARRVSRQVVAAPFDPAVGAALAGVGDDPRTPSYLDPSLAIPLQPDSPIARRQDAIGSMLWRALHPEAEQRTQILTPPLTWELSSEDAQAIMTTLATSINAGLATPRSLPAVIAETSASTAAVVALDAPAADSAGRFDDAVIGEIVRHTGQLWGLTAAMTTDPRTGLTGQQYTAPLREDMLRALSQSMPPDTRNGRAGARLTAVGRTIGDLFNAVTIVRPSGAYTLATERSPLPLALRNDLPVPIRVTLAVRAPPGMTVTDVGEQVLPPGYLPLRVPVEVHFTQRVAVDVTLQTPDGLPLGEPVRLSVHSNAYGKVLFAITMVAAAVLVALSGRRLWHRFKGQPDRADLDRPGRSTT